MRYKVEVLQITDKKLINRYPSLEDVKKAIDDYSEGFKGIVILHDTLYDYNYDTSGTNYHKVDSTFSIGHIESSVIEDNTLYIDIDVSKDLNLNKKYICFYRANMESMARLNDKTLSITDLFAVDLVIVADSEISENMRFSEISVIE